MSPRAVGKWEMKQTHWWARSETGRPKAESGAGTGTQWQFASILSLANYLILVPNTSTVRLGTPGGQQRIDLYLVNMGENANLISKNLAQVFCYFCKKAFSQMQEISYIWTWVLVMIFIGLVYLALLYFNHLGATLGILHRNECYTRCWLKVGVDVHSQAVAHTWMR